MAIRIRSNINAKLSVFILLIVYWLSACERLDSPPGSDKNLTDSSSEATAISPGNETFSLEELEQRLLPLQDEITRLETELETSQKISNSTLQRMDDKQWNVSQLNEQISTLQQDNEDLKSQVKAQHSEIQTLQEALNQQKIKGMQEDTE